MAETLKEFVVKLKYQQEGEKEIVSGVESVGKRVVDLGVAIATAVAGVALAVGKYAQGMEQLDFIAIRTRTTVDNLRALQTAGASLGGTAAGMTSSLEGVSRFMRNTPGSSAFLASMGVETKDANGKDLDRSDVMKNIGKAFRGMDQPIANLYAQQLGIDENTELAMRDPSFDKNYSAFRSPLGHLDETAKTSNTAVNKGRVVALTAEDLAARAAKPVLDGFNQLDTATHGLSTQIGAAAIGVTALGSAAAVAAKLWRAIAPVAAPAAAGVEAGAAGAAAGAGMGIGAKIAAGALSLSRGISGIGMLLYSPSLNAGEDEEVAKMRSKPINFHRGEGSAGAAGAAGAKNPAVSDALLDAVRHVESGGNRLAVSPKGAKGPYQLGKLVTDAAHVDPFNEQQSRGAASDELGRLLKKYHGDQIMALRAYNWGQGNLDSYLKTGQGLHGGGMPKEAQDYPGKVIARMAQNVNITINGASDPKATGMEVRKQLAQLQSRNSAGAVR